MDNNSTADQVFFGCLVILLLIGRMFMGCELNLKAVRDALQRPVAPIIGFCTQFLIMPLLAFGLTRLLLADQEPYAQLGLFVMGCVPGGDASNFWTYMLDGNVNLSVTMTFVSTVASLVMTTLWIKILGSQLINQQDVIVKIPYLNLISSLAFLTFTLLVGITITRYRPSWANMARKALRPFIYFVVGFIIVFGTVLYHSVFIQHITWNAVLAAFLLPCCGFYCGLLAAYILDQRPEDVVAIAIETGVQSMPIAIAVLKISFPEWNADERLLEPVLVGAATPFPILLFYGVQKLFIWMHQSRSVEIEDIQDSARFTDKKSHFVVDRFDKLEVPDPVLV